MKFGKIGKRIVAGTIKTAKATGGGIKRVGEWQETNAEKSALKRGKELKRVNVELELAQKKAKLRKFKGDKFRDPFDEISI